MTDKPKLETMTIPPDAYSHKDIDIISDLICEILAEGYDIVVDSLSFEIEVSFTRAEETDA